MCFVQYGPHEIVKRIPLTYEWNDIFSRNNHRRGPLAERDFKSELSENKVYQLQFTCSVTRNFGTGWPNLMNITDSVRNANQESNGQTGDPAHQKNRLQINNNGNAACRIVKKIYVTRRILDPGLPMLSRKCHVTLNEKPRPPSRAEILRNVAGKHGILCMLSDKIDSKVMNAAGPNLKVVSSYSTGFEHIDIKEATARGIYVTYTGDILTEATADLTFALILACARRIVNADRYVREKRWNEGWSPDLMLGYNVHGATLGIIGLGRIGTAVARRARGFGMKILYHNRTNNRSVDTELGAKYTDLDDLLARSDFVSIQASLNSGSVHLIDKRRLRDMKKTAFLINTARGQIVNEDDLAQALKSNQIAGAALDVFENEPLSTKSPLLKMRNVVVLPHIGSATYETRSKMAEVAAKNLLDVLDGKSPEQRFLVNPEVMNVRPL